MDIYKQVETDEELKLLIPLIEEFSKRANVSFWGCLNEVTVSIANLSHLTMTWKSGDIFKGYICGFFISPTEFWLTQGIKMEKGESPEDVQLVEMFMKKVIKRGGRRILGQTVLDPLIFKRWGLKFHRYLVVRDFTEDEIKEV